jgi:hypothetical protein
MGFYQLASLEEGIQDVNRGVDVANSQLSGYETGGGLSVGSKLSTAELVAFQVRSDGFLLRRFIFDTICTCQALLALGRPIFAELRRSLSSAGTAAAFTAAGIIFIVWCFM